MGAESSSDSNSSSESDNDDDDDIGGADGGGSGGGSGAPSASSASAETDKPTVEFDALQRLLHEFNLFSEPLYVAVKAAGGGGTCAHVVLAGERAGAKAGASVLQYRKLHKVKLACFLGPSF
jgi:hypothetical protein